MRSIAVARYANVVSADGAYGLDGAGRGTSRCQVAITEIPGDRKEKKKPGSSDGAVLAREWTLSTKRRTSGAH
jgi:hypothetical protein